MTMAKFPQKHGNKKQSVLFVVLILTLTAFGQDNYDGDYDNGDNNGDDDNNNEEATTTVGPRGTTTASPSAAISEDRIVERILARLNVTLVSLNFKMDRMQSQIRRIEAAGSRPNSPPGSAPTTSSTIFASNNVRTNTIMIQDLQDLVLSLKNKTENSQSYNETSAAILEMSRHFQSELQGVGYRIDTLANDLRSQNLENLQIAFGRMARIGQVVDDLAREKKEEKRVKVVSSLLEAWRNEQAGMVKALLDDLTKEGQLNSSIAEIVRGMFDGRIGNYPKVINLFQSAKREQFKSGLSSLIDLFHSATSTSSSAPGGGNTNSNSNSNTNVISRPLRDEPEYLNLAYLAKNEFGNELGFKFSRLLQTLVFGGKVCVRNLITNFYLSVDKGEGPKDGGYSVSSRKKSSTFSTAVLCDWEIVSPHGASFIIRRKSQAETLNLHVLEGTAYAGSDDFNPSYFWKVLLRGNAQKLILESIPASSEDPAYFLCSVKPHNQTTRSWPLRKLELLNVDEGTRCEWTVDPPQ